MPVLRLNLLMAATALCLTGCGNLTAAVQQKDYTSLSLQLKKDMSEEDVSKTMGSAPDKTDMVTCVDHAGSPWQCRTWIFNGGRPRNNVRVVFYQSDDKAWRVVSWQNY